MSLFRKPKKPMQRRVFSALDEDTDEVEKVETEAKLSSNSYQKDFKSEKEKDKSREKKTKSASDETKSKSLLSFADDEEEDEVFQVKKTTQSKKVMRMLDKERRKKAKGDLCPLNENGSGSSNSISRGNKSNASFDSKTTGDSKPFGSPVSSRFATPPPPSISKKSDVIQTEIRTDDFVLVVKKSEPVVILNGRAAVCAGRDDLSDDDEQLKCTDESVGHRFAKPEQLRQILESGSIPDAAMIHAARKRRQKARELGDCIPVEENEKDPPNRKGGSRLMKEDPGGEESEEEERVDMNAISGIKEREERREQFYSVENSYSDDDSDIEINEWENQQIRKGVTAAQLNTVQQDNALSRFIMKSSYKQIKEAESISTSILLGEAYAKSSLENSRQISFSKQKNEAKASSLRTPGEIRDDIQIRLTQLQELYNKHISNIDEITAEIKSIQLKEMNCSQKAPVGASKYRFYQELRAYLSDLIECLSEKAPFITELEKKALGMFARHSIYLVERRRQDVRDQAKEMAEATKPVLPGIKKDAENEEQKRRAAEREGRRTRRRCEREKNGQINSHLDGMSSDDEIPDQYEAQYRMCLDQMEVEADDLFADTCEDFCQIAQVLLRFENWRKTDMNSYKDSFVSLCLPKILGPLIRVQMITWYPLGDKNHDIEKCSWYSSCMLYGWSPDEIENGLVVDPDIKLVPAIVEKIIVPKLAEIIEKCWDPLSTTQNLRLIALINRLGAEYPLKESSKGLQNLFTSILDKMKSSLENDVFIPIFPKQIQEAKTSFFQRQFCSGLKLFRNLLSWQGILADKPLRELAISSLLNRYLLAALRVCTSNDALSKAYVIVNTLPTVWLQPNSETMQCLQLFIVFIKNVLEMDSPLNRSTCEKAKQILQKLHSLDRPNRGGNSFAIEI